MTNLDYIKTFFDAETFADWVLYEAPQIARTYTQSHVGLAEWLKKECVVNNERTD